MKTLRAIVLGIGVVALSGSVVACGGGDKKADTTPAKKMNPCEGKKTENPCEGKKMENPCEGKKANPCDGKMPANPCEGKKNPCEGKTTP